MVTLVYLIVKNKIKTGRKTTQIFLLMFKKLIAKHKYLEFTAKK